MSASMGKFAHAHDWTGGERGDVECVRVEALDITVTPMTGPEVASLVGSATEKRLLLNHNLHSAYLHDVDEKFRQLYRRADWVVIDGAPILWMSSLSAKKRLPAVCRISSPDWIAELPNLEVPRRMFVYGAVPESNSEAVSVLRQRLVGWTIDGIDGYVDEVEAVERIKAFNPNLVIVGLGMPRQEYFLLRNLPELPDAVYATVGGAIDYIGGTTRLAPRWMGRLGIEWLWRLANEPRRLAFRYLVEPLLLGYRAVGVRGARQVKERMSVRALTR